MRDSGWIGDLPHLVQPDHNAIGACMTAEIFYSTTRLYIHSLLISSESAALTMI